ncbi:MAG: lamin tail domain-containing protein [Fibrobacter sp.]|nr:lamin tail domain-containing protein [Fibrobacter sp.]
MFVEIFPDPKFVSDNEGEFVEIRFDEFRADSLYVRFEEKAALAFRFPRNANRMVLVHDSTQCPKRDSLACGLLGTLTLPNSRESYWKLWAGSCADSVSLSIPKEGSSFQRVGEGDDWVLSKETFGTANADYEIGIQDCGLSWGRAKYADGEWSLRGFLTGCDSAKASLEVLDLGTGLWRSSETLLSGTFSFDVRTRGSAWVRLILPMDAAPANDTLDSLFVVPGNAPVVISEVHHCPEEPLPEWVEVYNASKAALPLSRLSFCGRGNAWGGLPDSLQPYESVLITKDTAGLREQLGFSDVRIFFASLGFLNNTAGSLTLCVDQTPVDSAFWNKNTVACPLGFNPRLGLAENTPGFQRSSSESTDEDPFKFKLSTRVVRKRGAPLRVLVTSESEVRVRLLDSAGHGVWKQSIPSGSSSWLDVPAQDKCKIGVCYVSFKQGSFEKVVGFVVRP